MNNSPLTSGQKAAATRKANEKARRQAQAKKDAWATRRERYGVTGMKNAVASLTNKPKELRIELGKFVILVEEDLIGKIAMHNNIIRFIK